MNTPAPRLCEIDFLVTHRCNLRCGYCSVDANSPQGPPMPMARVLALLDEARGMGLQELHFTGGEPTLEPALATIIQHATHLGLNTRLITNGTVLDRDGLQRLVSAGLPSIMVSIDGLQARHDALRGSPGSWAKAMATVSLALEAGLRTRVSAAAFRDNLEDIPRLASLVAGMGVHVFSVFLGSPLGRGRTFQGQTLDAWRWRQLLRQLRASVEAGALGPHMQVIAEQGWVWPTGRGVEDGVGRGAGCRTLLDSFDYLMLRRDGRLHQCVFYMHDGPPLADVSQMGLADALALAQTQGRYATLARPPTACSTCTALERCAGGCRGYAWLATGQWHTPDPRCPGLDPMAWPICPIAKLNLRTGRVAGSSELALVPAG